MGNEEVPNIRQWYSYLQNVVLAAIEVLPLIDGPD